MPARDDDKLERESMQLAANVKAMRERMPALLEFQQLQAAITRAKFVALVDAGFTEVQALQLCQQK